MSNTQAQLGDSLMKSLTAKRAEKGELSLEDIGLILQDATADMQASGGSDSVLRQEITKMADGIKQAKAEIAAISDTESKGEGEGIAGATVHLDAVVKSTEKATNEIMDAADAIQAAAGGVGGDAEQQIMDASMKIYEACNFQDLTGQQINKVVALIGFLEERVQALTSIFAGDEVTSSAPIKNKVVDIENVKDEDLMNGPQLAQPSQDDIDALFDSVETKS